MEITGLNKQIHSDTPSNTRGAKNSSETGMFETFEKEILNWQEKIKEKINTDLENDSKKNIKMSDKQWNALITKVDSAINTYKQDIKEEKEEENLLKKKELNNIKD